MELATVERLPMEQQTQAVAVVVAAMMLLLELVALVSSLLDMRNKENHGSFC